MPPAPTHPAPRFMRSFVIDPYSGCWLWQKSLRSGYGYVWTSAALTDAPTKTPAHRWAYETFVGPVPEGLVVDHMCAVRNCVNPRHLQAITHADNIRRAPPKPMCRKGLHPFDEANTIIRSDGGRRCAACRRANRERPTAHFGPAE